MNTIHNKNLFELINNNLLLYLSEFISNNEFIFICNELKNHRFLKIIKLKIKLLLKDLCNTNRDLMGNSSKTSFFKAFYIFLNTKL